MSPRFYNFFKLLLLSIILLLLNFSFQIPEPSHAHPQPLVVQEFLFRYRTDEVRLDYRLRVDPVVQADVFKVIDKNLDQKLSEDELKDYWNNIINPNLTSRLNNRDLKFEILTIKPVAGEDLRSLDDFAEIQLKAIDPLISKTNSSYVKFDYKFIPNDPFGDYYAYNDDIFETPGIERINLDSTNPNGQVEYSTDFRFTNGNIPVKTEDPKASSGQAAFRGDDVANSNGNFLQDLSQLSTNLTNQVKNFDFNNPFIFLTAFVLLFIAGALHALTPGHGKSMVAAFLIGKKKSKLADVLILGIAITLSHTLAIYIIGFILLALRQTAYAQNIVVAIERLSAWLFLGLGFILIYNGYRAYRHFEHHQKEHSHHHHSHDHGHTHSWDKKKLKISNRWDLFYAGISGGIVPCFDALSILFVFNAIGRVDLGIILVFIFSLGLAAAIILLGVSLLYGRDFLKLEERIGPKAEFILPILSGSFIALFGVFYILTK